MSAKVSAAECDHITDDELLALYIEFVEDFPDYLAKILSMFKECAARANQLIKSIDSASAQISLQNVLSHDFKEMLESLLVVLQNVNDEKLELASKLKDFIAEKIERFDSNKHANMEKSSRKVDQSLSSNSKEKPSQVKQKRIKRLRVTKRALFQDNANETLKEKLNEKVVVKKERIVNENPGDLLMLAQIATQKSQISATLKSKTKIHRKKQTNSPAKLQIKEAETDESEDISDAEEGNEEEVNDEPLYCLCNKASYGPMIECDNEGCSLEWFHFECVDLKRAPKGKWYCPKCRSKKSNMLRKELVS